MASLDCHEKMTVLTDRSAVQRTSTAHHLFAEPDGLDEEDDGVINQIAVHHALGLQAVQLRGPALHVSPQGGNLRCRLALL